MIFKAHNQYNSLDLAIEVTFYIHMHTFQQTTLQIRGTHLAKYKLVGVVVHKQWMLGQGHYTAFIRSRVNSMHWFNIDDSEVHSEILADLCICYWRIDKLVYLHVHVGYTRQCCYCSNAATVFALLRKRR